MLHLVVLCGFQILVCQLRGRRPAFSQAIVDATFTTVLATIGSVLTVDTQQPLRSILNDAASVDLDAIAAYVLGSWAHSQLVA